VASCKNSRQGALPAKSTTVKRGVGRTVPKSRERRRSSEAGTYRKGVNRLWDKVEDVVGRAFHAGCATHSTHSKRKGVERNWGGEQERAWIPNMICASALRKQQEKGPGERGEG